jgi:hypothetical protein
MRLRFVMSCHFGKSELTNWFEVVAQRPEFVNPKSRLCLKHDDVVLLVSKSGNQLVFLHGFDIFEAQRVLRSTRLRIASGARWNPLMLVNYAKSIGLNITGLKTYEEHVAGVIQTVGTQFTQSIGKALTRSLTVPAAPTPKKGK